MKTIPTPVTVTLSVVILSLLCAQPLFGDEPVAAGQKKGKAYSGTVTVVDLTEKTVAVKGLLFSKTFNAADTCKVSLEDKPDASLDELRPGHKVSVHYQNAQGVLVASQIVQRNVILKGSITAIDPGERTLVVKGPAGTRDFTIAKDCDVILKDEKVGTLENLKIGHAVSVAYESTGGAWTAHKIEQKCEEFAGTIQAIDAGTRTVKAKSLLSEKKFNLADGCRIVVEGKPATGLRDLRIGDHVEFSYEDANGVLVANRIGRGGNTSETQSTQAARISNQ